MLYEEENTCSVSFDQERAYLFKREAESANTTSGGQTSRRRLVASIHPIPRDKIAITGRLLDEISTIHAPRVNETRDPTSLQITSRFSLRFDVERNSEDGEI